MYQWLTSKGSNNSSPKQYLIHDEQIKLKIAEPVDLCARLNPATFINTPLKFF